MADWLGVCTGRKVFLLALVVCLVYCGTNGVFAAVAQAELSQSIPDCTADYGQPGTPAVVPIMGNCTWSTLHQGSRAVIRGFRTSLGLHSNESATPAIFAATAAAPGNSAASTGVLLHLERVVLVGFQISPPDAASAQPVLWPGGLVAGIGQSLNMTDVRVIVNTQELFNKYLEFFTNQNTLFWTDNTNFLHISQWSDARTQLRSVSVLFGSSAPGSPATVPIVKNCLMLTTNTTLVSALIPHAAVATPLPLLVYLTSNVTIGMHPPLPSNGVVIKRPVVFVGVQSAITSIDFEMVVNQLNASASQYANTTFVGLALENLGPGDIVTSAVAAPFSIAIVNNVWAVYYNRSVPQQVRWTMNNVTMVLPQDSEMSYVTYMFTLYNSPLQYLKAQTAFYSDVLHMSMLQFQPGPGNASITVTHIYSWYHRWDDVVLTTRPQVAKELPLPSRPLPALTSSTRASPLVQAVRTGEELRAFAEQPVLGDREHILLFLANVSLPVSAHTPSSNSGISSRPIESASVMSWVGYNPGVRRSSAYMLADASAGVGTDHAGPSERVSLDCAHMASAVYIPPSLPKDALQLQQLVLSHLPQGPEATVPSQFRAVPAALFTLMLWTFDRPHDLERSLRLVGVSIRVPQPEFDYFKAFAQNANFFVVEMSGMANKANSQGPRADALTFENAYYQGDMLRVDTITGPGFLATNVTLLVDADAVAAMPGGYHWPDPSQLHLPPPRSGHPTWVIAVIAVCVALAVLLLALAGYMWWQRKRICLRDPESGQLFMQDGSFSKLPSPINGSQPDRLHSHSEYSNSHCSHPCTSTTPCASCAALKVAGANSGSIDVHLLGSGSGVAAAISTKQSPRPGRKEGSDEAAALGLGAAAAGVATAGAWQGAGSPPSGCSPSSGRQGRGKDVASQRDASPFATTAVDSEGSSLQDNVAAGMQRWRAAVSSTTMLLMERRMDAAAALSDNSTARTGSVGNTVLPSVAAVESGAHAIAQQADAQQQSDSAGSGGSMVAAQQQLQLQELLGQGSFGSVFLALWRGKRVAVKVMQLPASALLDPGEQLSIEHAGQQSNRQQQHAQEESAAERRRRLQRQKQQNSAPHMAIMEAVVSSTMCHPNVVQVFTYMLSPLTSSSSSTTEPKAAAAEPVANGKQVADNGHAKGGGSSGQDIAGWSLKLVMEYCNEGSLRDALDCGLLAKPGGFLAPSAVLALAHDVAAAMLHLHSEGIVHGDLKAGNVMLTSSSAGNTGTLPSVRMWASPGDRPLTAKVADFGLALPLGPRDTHATLLARGTPTHMSPELLISGHVSKASDVYAYGILLYEIMTAKRAYAGIPIPLLPHEVAMQGLRPEWPQGMPPGCRDLKKLAIACWAQKPQDRPTFTEILQTLDIWSAGGHGWPAVPPSSRANPLKRQEQQQQKHQQAQVQAAADEQLQQQQQKDAALSAPQPATSPQQQQAASPPEQQQLLQQQGPHVQRAVSLRAAGDAAGRNMHMSWSEVDVNEDCAEG